MLDSRVLEICSELDLDADYVIFPGEFFREATILQAELAINNLPKSLLMKLPQREIDFFEWLKSAEKPVWDDLWGNEETGEYIVSISFLPLLLDSDYHGFPICDLENNDNYYFTAAHMVDEESKMMIDSTKTMFLDRKQLTLPQLLALQISVSPIDIWHFAYKSKISVESAKKAVEELVADGVLVHLRSAEHLTTFLEF